LLLLGLVFPAPSRLLGAESAQSLIRQIKKEKAALGKIAAEIKKNQQGKRRAKKKERSILRSLEKLDRRISLARKEVALIEIKIRQKEQEEAVLSAEIKSASAEIKKTQAVVFGHLRRLYKEKQGASLKILTASKDYPEFLRRLHYLETLSEKEEGLLSSFKKEHEVLFKKKQEMAALRSRLVEDREVLAEKLDERRAERKKKRRFLARIRKEQRLYEQVLSEMAVSSKKIRGIIHSLQGRKSRLQASLPERFSRKRGQLSWPNEGRIVSRFGKQKHPKFDTTVYRKGIEIAPGRQEQVRAIFGGSVVYADWFRGYGMMVIIDHGENYYSLYAHLEKLLVGVGEKVSTRRVIGTVGKTGLSQGTRLYFEIRHQGDPVNPLRWLKKRG